LGNRTDGSWTTSVFNGFLNIKAKYPQVQITFADAIPFGDMPTWLNMQNEAGVSLFYLDSAMSWQKALETVAPGTVGKSTYFCPGSSFTDLAGLAKNVSGLERGQYETAFLCGVAAGMVSKTGVIGFVGGQDFPELIRKLAAYEIGAKCVNPNIKVVYGWIGSWLDIGKGYEVAQSLIGQGADVLMEHADDAGKGVVQAAVEKNLKIIGFALDKLPQAPDNVITTALLDLDQLMEYSLWINNAGKQEEVAYQFTLKEGWRGITPLTNVNQDVIDTVAKYKKLIFDRTITIPNIPKTDNLGKLDPTQFKIPTASELK
jgi:basic membrane protein A and related proteins